MRPDADDLTYLGRTVNLALQGAYIALKSSPKISTATNLRFSLVPHSLDLEFLAGVVRTDSQGIGVKLLKLDNQLKSSLHRFIKPTYDLGKSKTIPIANKHWLKGHGRTARHAGNSGDGIITVP